MDPNRFVKVTGVDLRLLIAAAYDLSQGGEAGPIPDATVDDVLCSFKPFTDGGCALSIDGVMGRNVKLNIWKSGEDLYIERDWVDHTSEEMTSLLERLDLVEPE